MALDERGEGELVAGAGELPEQFEVVCGHYLKAYRRRGAESDKKF
jgi:hypothetical protein